MDLRNARFFAHRVCMVFTLLMIWSGSVLAQSGSTPDVSPLAPGTLKAPVFDTTTPHYDTAHDQAKSAGTVVAEVDGRAITLGEVRDTIAEQPPAVRALPFDTLYPGILAQLVRQEALVIRAHRHGIDDDPGVRRKLKAASDKVLAASVLEREAARGITEAALLDKYNKDIAGKPGPEEVHVRVIMVATEQAAMDAIGQLRGGADFADLARRISKDATALAGGDAGFVTLDGLTPEVGAVVFSMAPGTFTPFPVRGSGAWFVLKVEGRRFGAPAPFGVARAGLRQALVRDGAAAVVKAALADVTVREYDIGGKEAHKLVPKDDGRYSK